MAELDPTIFGEYDIRGVYPTQFNEDAPYRIARSYAQVMHPGVAIVGHDMRTSSQPLVEAVCSGLMDEGSDIILIGMTSTPMFYYAVNALNGDIGITVTASHNPPDYNGMKMTGPKAIPSIDFVSMDQLRQTADENKFEEPPHKGTVRQTINPVEDYVKAIWNASDLQSDSALKLVIDAGNGMEGLILPYLFAGTDFDVSALYWTPNGKLPHHIANPLIEDTLNDLKEEVARLQTCLGIAYDGDGDRVGFIDETGCHIPGDIMTAVIAREMLKQKPSATIIYDVRSSWAVREEIEKAGGKPFRWKVGHALIKKKMREIGAFFGGELSTHYYFQNFHVTDNGDLAMLKVLRALLTEKKTLSELARPIMRYFHSPEINSTVANRDEKIAQVKDEHKDGRVDELDGLTVEYDDWWFNLRPSRTEPLLRLNVEAKTLEKMQDEVTRLVELIRGAPPTQEELTPMCCR